MSRTNSVKSILVELLVIVAIGLVLGLIGPFGSNAISAGPRLLYWAGFTLVGYALFRPVSIVARWLTEQSALPLWAAMIVATLVAALPLSWIIGFALGGMRYDPRILGDGFLVLYAECAGVGIVIYVLMRKLFPVADTTITDVTVADDGEETPSSAAPLTEPGKEIRFCRLQRRLPPAFGEIMALGVEDHYVRVYSDGHSEMLLMRLADAIGEMDGIEGLQVHRSWWVARNAVRDAHREGRAVNLRLTNGLTVPVSRANVTHLKNSGWLSGIGV